MLERRIPARKTVVLDNRKLFIFPSRAGFGFALVLLLTWLMAVNYQNNLIFGFTFLLASVFVVAILHSYANLHGISVSVVSTAPAYAGERAEVVVRLTQSGRRPRDSISLSYPGSRPVIVALAAQASVDARLFVPSHTRGWLQPGRLTLESTYPLGLLRVWTHIKPDLACLVYPRPINAVPLAPTRPVRGDGRLSFGRGSEDFSRLEAFRSGESLRHVAWKQYAREQGMHTKHYTDPADEQVWLDWDAFPGMNREARLSRLCGWLLTLTRGNSAYGLRLPGLELAPARGEKHRDNILRQLALFELDPNQ